MAGFLDFNPDNVNYQTENKPLPAGTYEMIIKSVEVRATKGTNPHEYLNFDLVVRKDLDQVGELSKTNAKQHGRHVFVSVWTLKDSSGNDSGKYDPRVLKHIAKVAGVPKTDFQSIEEYMNALFNKPVRASVTVRENEYQGKKTKRNESTPIYFKPNNNKASYIGWYKTRYQLQSGVAQQLADSNPATKGGQDPFAETNGKTLTDNDLPF
ncbi:DUF669 domain-containing protein [Lactobacillus paragasseri]|uniref:DUF669 domain-containing protein n=1 Tax=Lactobacillus paragasseri TaxID=2107999 RepID=UPI0025505BD3|nr:DUF669 domain-containing protein [Lactobacillus paragasseri]MDK7137116.1 DUF669 domain-containing protein [Lactobacillus paragasseri]